MSALVEGGKRRSHSSPSLAHLKVEREMAGDTASTGMEKSALVEMSTECFSSLLF